MKSQVSVLLHVLDGVFKDAHQAYPELEDGFLKDKERIALNVQKRGLTFFTLDLPCLDAILLTGLEQGRLICSGPLSKRVSKRIQVPRFLSGLWLRVFDTSSYLRQDVDSTALAFLRQISCLGKKLRVECSEERINASIKGFCNVEKELRYPTLSWDSDTLNAVEDLRNCALRDCVDSLDRVHDHFGELQSSPGWNCTMQAGVSPSDGRILDKVQQVADLISDALGQFSPLLYSITSEQNGRGIGTRHGPGVVAERLGNHEKSSFPNWPHKLERRFPFDSFGKTIGATRDRPLNHELPSHMKCVPKTAKGPRLIAAEPVAHQWCQQLIRHWLHDRLESLFKGDFINFRKQSASGDMVLQSSLDRKLATVDLSDASDRLSCWTVERMFRGNPSLLYALHAVRTRWLRQDIDASSDSFIKLKKFASQGTATTFPVQSIVFLIIALASAIGDGEVTMERIKKFSKSVRVYGDDIIIPTYGYARLVRIMELLQLKVNVAKSYKDGHFRESCGTDGYMGYDVTPIKPQCIVADGPTSCQAVIDTSNNLFNKGYWHASNNLLSTIPIHVQRGLRIVAERDVGFSGLTSFCGSDESHLKKRWNSSLHRYEGRVWSLSPISLKRERNGFVPLLDFFSRVYDSRNPRIASVYGQVRKVCSDLLWEPLNHGARGNVDLIIRGQGGKHF